MSRLFFWRDTTGAQDSYQFRVSYDLRMGLTPRPPFLCLSGAHISNNPMKLWNPVALEMQ